MRRTLVLSFWLAISLAFGTEEKQAFVSGSFDPVTFAHIGMMEKSFEMGATHLTVFVNEDGPKSFEASTNERIQMLRLGTEKWKDKITIVSGTTEDKNRIVSELKGTTLSFIGSDSFEKLPKEVWDQKNREWAVFARPGYQLPKIPTNAKVILLPPVLDKPISSSEQRKLIGAGGRASDIPTSVSNYIQKKGLYRAPTEDLLHLQAAFYAEAFKRFQKDFKVRFPNLETRWGPLSPFSGTASIETWTDRYLRSLFLPETLSSVEKRDILKEARELLESKDSRENIYPKFPFLKVPNATPELSAINRLKPIEPIVYAKSPKEYDFDVMEYILDRFPHDLQRFVHSNHIPLYFHSGTSASALGFHEEESYSPEVQISTFRGFKHRSLFLVKSKNGQRRLVHADIRLGDHMHHVQSWMGNLASSEPRFLVDHAEEPPLFELNDFGKDLHLTDKDHVVVGFKNGLWRRLQQKGNWERVPLTESGVEMALYKNKRTGERIVSIKAVYGDEIIPILEHFYKRGMRRLSYFGTSGGLETKMNVGDVVAPTSVVTNSGEIPLSNRAAKFHRATKHGGVTTLLEETRDYLDALKAKGVSAIDIEVAPMARFLKDKPEIESSALLYISDKPADGISLSAHTSLGHLVDRAFEKTVDSVVRSNCISSLLTTGGDKTHEVSP